MSSINQFYTMKYEQPEDYRYSHDSVFLARYAYESLRLRSDKSYNTVADFCSGCGIIGIDFLIHLNQNHCKLPLNFDFIEVQDVYEKFFEQNRTTAEQLIQSKVNINFINQNYSSLIDDTKFSNKYDLILCNPPYFVVGQGKLSPSEFKNRCRFFIDSDFDHLLKSIRHCLKNQGEAFVLLRSLRDHNQEYDLKKLSQDYGVDLKIVCDIRGTDVLKVQKNT